MIEKPLSRLCADLVVTCLAGLLLSPPVPAAEQIVIFGDGNTWRIRHHGVSSQSFLGTNTDASPCATVAAALEATRLTNHAEFGARFAGLTSEPRRHQAERLFNQWQSDARGYSHLIIDEAVASADGANAANPNAAAVSLAPFVPDAQGRKLLIVPGSRPTAVLLTNADNAWKINVGAQGEPVLNYLTKEALREVAPEAFAEETVRQAAGQREAYKLLARQLSLYEKGVHPATLGIAAKERYQLASKGVVITNWAAWKDYYNCQEFNPPVVYDMRDAWTPDFSTPLSAQRSYRHALHAADGKTLHDHMDASARDAFAFTYGTNWVSRTTFLLLPNIIKSIAVKKGVPLKTVINEARLAISRSFQDENNS